MDQATIGFPLILPALKGYMGDRYFYTACMKMSDLADRVEIASVIHKSRELSRLIQREVSGTHAASIKEYLIGNNERFFNALVIGIYGGDPQWFELDVGGNSEFPNGPGDELEGMVGYLRLTGNERLFAIDGQHRVVGIQQALSINAKLGEEEVTVILVAHKNDTKGEQRTRRLFTTLNRYSKQVSILEKIALDEDDVIAITTRRLMEDNHIIRDRLSINKGKAIQTSDKTHLTTVAGLYDALEFYLKPNNSRGWSNFKRFRPNEQILQEYYDRATTLLQQLYENIPELQEYVETSSDASPYRNASGGHLLFRPIGLDIIFRVIRILTNGRVDVKTAVRRVANTPLQVGQRPWVGVLWNPVGRMLTDSVNKRVAIALMLQNAGGDLSIIGMTKAKLRTEIAGLQGR